MKVEEALAIMQKKENKRFDHIVGTYEMATQLADLYQIDRYKCQIAAILHDYAKNESIDRMEQLIKKHLDTEFLKYSTNVYHAPVGKYLVKQELTILDDDILNAILFHVTGHKEMNDIAKIVFISDYIEKTRTHPPVNFCRYLAEHSLDLAVVGICEHTLLFLNRLKQGNIHPWLNETYQEFLEKVGESYYDSIKINYQGM